MFFCVNDFFEGCHLKGFQSVNMFLLCRGTLPARASGSRLLPKSHLALPSTKSGQLPVAGSPSPGGSFNLDPPCRIKCRPCCPKPHPMLSVLIRALLQDRFQRPIFSRLQQGLRGFLTQEVHILTHRMATI